MSAFSTLEITIYNLIFVALAYSIIILQKEGAMKVPKFGDEKTTSVIKGLVKNKTWLAGVILNIIAIPYTTFLLSISSLSFMMIFHRAGIIIVFVYAFRTLKEKISRDEIIGLVILYTGFVLVLFVLQVETTGAFTGDLQGLIFFSTCGIMYVVTYIGFKKARSRVKAKEVILSVGAGFSGIGGTLALKVIPVVLSRDLSQPGYIFNLLDVPELFRVLTGVFVPSSGYFFSSIYFLVYMTSFSLNFLFLTTMYQHGRASVTIPLFNSINFLGTIVAGNLLFSEPLNAISWVGVIMMIVGILLASKIEKAIHEPKAAGGEQEKNMESP